MIDIATQLKAVAREVKQRPDDTGGELVSVLLRRRYDARVDDVWEAITDPGRLRRWFAPVSGELKVGGQFEVENNASGEILACERPSLLRLTYGGEVSVVEVRLAADENDDTVLELEHTVPLEIAGSVAGALYVGPGWDIPFLGLENFLRGDAPDDLTAWENSEDVQKFSQHAVSAWATAAENAGGAPDAIEAGRQAALAQFAPDLVT
ncbi:SRPBCC family protein [Prauserella muralis]|uniref:ATPase n=1 Tax=Prauserella muralis TaxID=588067 RepID=A0A2V4ATV9_9PSEU|nr:SRPBCC family protein [Prauserella muralis]PXY18987.1 ATPase [Prauserella muralis]TWE28879.1 uncharacterized protein YndB with AHSA1/START domain [Prauserella muralis]